MGMRKTLVHPAHLTKYLTGQELFPSGGMMAHSHHFDIGLSNFPFLSKTSDMRDVTTLRSTALCFSMAEISR